MDIFQNRNYLEKNINKGTYLYSLSWDNALSHNHTCVLFDSFLKWSMVWPIHSLPNITSSQSRGKPLLTSIVQNWITMVGMKCEMICIADWKMKKICPQAEIGWQQLPANPFISLDLGGVEDFYDVGIRVLCSCQYLGHSVVASILQILSSSAPSVVLPWSAAAEHYHWHGPVLCSHPLELPLINRCYKSACHLTITSLGNLYLFTWLSSQHFEILIIITLIILLLPVRKHSQ